MASVAPQFVMPRPVAKKMSRLRLLVRAYVWLEGLLALAVVAGGAYWLGLALDWLFEPTPAVRRVMWAATIGAAAWALARYIGRRALARLPDDSLALLVERRYPALAESLITTVQAGDRRHGDYHPELIAATSRRAAEAMPTVRLAEVFNRRPLAVKGVLALIAAGSVAAFAWSAPESFAFFNRRMKLDPTPWPRTVRLTVAGFDRDAAVREVRVARDSIYEVRVAASIVDGFLAPDEVEIRWRRLSDGLGSRDPMLRIGEAVAGRDDAQVFRYELKVTGDVEFDVLGGDDRVPGLRLVAVERPVVARAALDVTYPEYMQRKPRSIALSKRAELPAGSTAICRIEATKPLIEARVYEPSRQTPLPATIDPARPTEFSFPLSAAAGDLTLAIALVDADGVESLAPYGLAVSVVPDAVPELSVQLRGIGTAVTPQARIPAAGQITDDYALRSAWFEYQIDGQGVAQRPLTAPTEQLPRVRLDEAFDLTTDDPANRQPLVPVKPGQRLALAIQADDYYDLGEGAHVGSSQRFLLDVVTPSQLRSLLEKRELGLRQRFEAIYEKMVGVGELLGRIVPPAAALDVAAEGAPDGAAAEGLDESDSGSDRQRRLDASRLSGARQNATQLAFETSGVAEGFEAILAELVNNRVDTEELRQRLGEGIAAPLRAIATERLPELERLLAEHEKARKTPGPAAIATLVATRSEADAIINQMKGVLDRMLELESYNELVELLRGIVADQQELNDATKAEQRKKLRSLLED
ncbi:MAG: hypothetical protein KF688_18665 [Pirellulales bacterium]|nr:hypothetical protein [Pirellulales bacterium]